MRNIEKYLLISCLALMLVLTTCSGKNITMTARPGLEMLQPGTLESGISLTPVKALDGGISLEISSDSTEYTLGEPVVLYVTLRNNGAQPIEVMRLLEPEFGYVVYKIKSSNGEEVTFLPWAYKEHIDPTTTLASGESVYGLAKIFYGGNGWTFKEPGSYEVKAVYNEAVESNTLAIRMNAPKTADEQKASDLFLTSDEVGKFLLFEGGDHLKEGMARLNSVATQMPETTLASYANYALGNNLLSSFANFETNTVRQAEPQQAIRYLENAEAKPIGLYYTAQTSLDLSQGYLAIGNTQMAKETATNLGTLVSNNYAELKLVFSKAVLMNRKAMGVQGMDVINSALQDTGVLSQIT